MLGTSSHDCLNENVAGIRKCKNADDVNMNEPKYSFSIIVNFRKSKTVPFFVNSPLAVVEQQNFLPKNEELFLDLLALVHLRVT